MADNLVYANMLFYPLYYDITSLTSLKITQAFHLAITWFCWKSKDFKIWNGVQITEGSYNGDLDNWVASIAVAM